MIHGLRLLVIASLAVVLGCLGGEFADVEHNNVCIDLSPDGKTVVFSTNRGGGAIDDDLFIATRQ